VELNGYLRLIWASKRWLVLFAVVAAAVVYAISSSQSDEYESNALGQIVSTSQASGEILSEEQLLSLSNVYQALAKTTTVLDLAHKETAVQGKAAEFDSSVEVSPESRIGVLSFNATTGSPTRSAEFANAYAKAFGSYLGSLRVDQLKETLEPIQERINEIESELPETPVTDPHSADLQIELQALQEQIATQTANPGDSMRIVEQAAPVAKPVAPKPKRDAVLALIVALVLGACAIYLRDLLFDRYGSAQDAARDLDLQLLGEIPKGRKEPPVEAFRSLRTAMVFALERSGSSYRANGGGDADAGTVLITGAESGCGKSYVSANISRTLATEGRRVTIVDGDLRRPTLHQIFRSPLSPGLSDLLVNDPAPDLSEVTTEIRQPQGGAGTTGGLDLVPAGAHAEEAVESLSSTRMKEIIQSLRFDNDMVLFDSPPTLVVVDPVVLARYADGVVFVIDSRHTRRRDARRAIEALRATGAPLLGFAFNRSATRQSRYDAYRPTEPRQPAGRPKGARI
jgi:capsular exopolysaccharide synthesis family protein